MKSSNNDLRHKTRKELVDEVIMLRDGITKHAKREGHDCCWWSPELWSLVPGLVPAKPKPPEPLEFIEKCVHYRKSLDNLVDK
jgi:hypothetical protein